MKTLRASINTGVTQIIAIWIVYGFWSWTGGLPEFKSLLIATVLTGCLMITVAAFGDDR